MDDDLRGRLESLERNQRSIAGCVILAVWFAVYEVCSRGLAMGPEGALLTGAGAAFIAVVWLSARVRGL